MRAFRVLSVFAAISLYGTRVEAQFPQGGGGATRPVRVVLSGGMTLPAGDLADLHDAGFHYDASLLINFGGFPLTLRPEVSLSRFKLKDALTGPTASPDPTQLVSALGNIEIPLAAGLYVLAGGGILALSRPDGTSTTAADISANEMTFNAGAGLRFHIGGASGFLEARIGAASYDAGKVGFKTAQLIPVTFGLAF